MKKLLRFKLISVLAVSLLCLGGSWSYVFSADPTNPNFGPIKQEDSKKKTKKKVASNYKLLSILKTENGMYAVINDKLLGQNERIDGYRVKIKDSQTVILEGKKVNKTLTLVSQQVKRN